MNLTIVFATLKKYSSYLTAAAAVITAVVFFANGDTSNGWNALIAAGAALGVNLPVHAQVNAATK